MSTNCRISSFVNRVLCVFQTHSSEEDEVEKGAGNSFQADWRAAFVAIHAVAMTVIAVIFVLGYVIIL